MRRNLFFQSCVRYKTAISEMQPSGVFYFIGALKEYEVKAKFGQHKK